MDAFSLLSSGTKFNRKKYQNDMTRFKSLQSTEASIRAISAETLKSSNIPLSIDFFSSSNSTHRHTEDSNDVADAEEQALEPREEIDSVKLRRKHHIKVDGAGCPDLISTPQALVHRLSKLPAHGLYSNNRTSNGHRRRLEEKEEEGTHVCGMLLPNFSQLTPIQMQAIPIFLERRDLLACAPTGSGKTFSYLIPALALREKTIVVVPTFELVRQVRREAIKLADDALDFIYVGTPAAFVHSLLAEPVANSELPSGHSISRKDDGGHSDSGSDADITHEPMQTSKSSRSKSKRRHGKNTDDRSRNEIRSDWVNAKFAVFDEADRMWSDTEFLSAIDTILENLVKTHQRQAQKMAAERAMSVSAGGKGKKSKAAKKDGEAASEESKLTRPTIALFSATIPPAVEEAARSVCSAPLRLVVGVRSTPISNERVAQKLMFCGTEHGKLVQMRNLFTLGGLKLPVLVFVQSIKRCEELFKELSNDYPHIKLDRIHADRSSADRERIIDDFRLGKLWVLICTDLLARGVDFARVATVINYDLPTTILSYVHRVGRAGRGVVESGQEKFTRGEAYTFFSEEDKDYLKAIANMVREAGGSVDPWVLKLKDSRSKRKNWEEAPKKRQSVQEAAIMGSYNPEDEDQKNKKNKQKKQNANEKNSLKRSAADVLGDSEDDNAGGDNAGDDDDDDDADGNSDDNDDDTGVVSSRSVAKSAAGSAKKPQKMQRKRQERHKERQQQKRDYLRKRGPPAKRARRN
eukprot:ANDGO_08147.mRNA.1 ATP-dependent RNA helicase ROK1